MPKKNLDEEILKYLESIPFSATTEMVAKAVGCAWYTAQMHLMKLREEGKIKYFHIGRQNQFIHASKMR
jgi:hypothetical protein